MVYKRTLVENWDRIQPSGKRFAAFDPRCVVVVGNAGEQLRTPARRMSFELVRNQLSGVTVVTYDEVFERARKLLAMLESPMPDEREEIPF